MYIGGFYVKKQPEVTERTKQNLIDAFWQLYEEKSIEKIRIQEITNLAGYHRGTFYEYFLDIYDILNQEEEALIKELKEKGSDLQHSVQDDDFLKEITSFYLKNGKHLNLLIGSGGDPDFVQRLKKTLYPQFRKNIGLSDSDSSKLVYEFGISGILMAFHYWFENKEKITIEDFTHILYSLIGKGIFDTLNQISNEDTEMAN